MKTKFLFVLLSLFLCGSISYAQRKTDNLDRGLVAVKKASGVFVSWRVQADEYYGVKYNLYRDGSKIAENLNVSNYTDAAGSATSQYSVAAVVNGVEQSQCDVVLPWSNGTGNGPQYMPIKVADVKARDGEVVWKNENGTITKTINYSINDISLGDVDGDGKIDFIVKRINDDDRNNLFPTTNTTAFCRIEVYTSKKNYQLSWYIDCGPNTVFGSDEQWDAVAFDWDEDGKCEVLYRAYANTIIHKADGSTVTIGSANENIRAYVDHTANRTFTNCGNEYLVYMNGETGEPYVTMDYPLKRLESSEFSTNINWDNPTSDQVTSYLNAVNTAWGDSYGHRSSKYFMGAPYLDGRRPSIYLGRGIYTRTKMVAYDVDPATHALTKKWEWSNNTPGSGWYGQGYHNYAIADVDEDGCDEIVYGSMVIDNNGKGLSTTGLGHGDASHTGDLDPFRKGLETFACNEDEPGNNFRNATTCEIYYRNTAANDDGRSMAGNFTNLYPGSVGASTSSGIVSLASDKAIDGITNNWNNNTPNPIALNIRIYWDGDLLSETMNGPGANEGYMFVDKWGQRIFDTNHGAYETTCIGGSKKNLNAHGDILGDWREEIVIRKFDNSEFRIYTTTDETQYRIPCLWYDHQYRQGMVWESEGYNQPPHVSYFMGEMEGLTKVPVPYTMAGRVEITEDGGEIPASANGKDVFVYNKGNVKIPNGGVSPRSLIINTPSSVDGNDGNGIFRVYSETQLGNGSLMGGMNLVKQGDGMLKMEQSTYEYTGNTDVFAGSLYMKGSIPNSPVWMNRHTTLFACGTFGSSVTMEYGSKLYVNGSLINGSGEVSGYDNSVASIKTLNLHEGSRVILDIDPKLEDEHSSDILNLETLSIRKRDWQYGPKYLAPIFEFNFKTPLTPGSYPIGTLSEVSEGSLGDIILEGDFGHGNDVSLELKNGILYLNAVDNGKEYIGKDDKSTGFWGDFSDSYTIKPGYKYNLKFTNYGNSEQKYQNWDLVVANGSGHSKTERSDYAEYFVIRADKEGWGAFYDANNFETNINNWDTFKTDMQDANVDMTITFENGVFKMSANIICTTGNNYTYSYISRKLEAEDLTVFFTVDKSYMTHPVVTEEEIEETNETPTVTTDYLGWIEQNRITNNGDGTYTSANNAGNQYALALSDLSTIDGGIDNAEKITIEFDSQISSGSRFLIGIGDKKTRGTTANGSSKTTYNTDGLFMRYGSSDGSYYRLNGGSSISGFDKVVHCKFVLDRVNKTYSYTLSSGSTVLSSGQNISTAIDNATIIEAYTWQNSATVTLSDVTVTVERAYVEPAEPENPNEPTGKYTVSRYVNGSLVGKVNKEVENGKSFSLAYDDKTYYSATAKYKYMGYELESKSNVNVYFETMGSKNSYVEDIDRGLAVVPVNNSNGTWVNNEGLVSWRRLATDDDHTTFDLLLNGNPIATDLRVTNYYTGVNAGREFVVVTKVDGVEVSRTAPVKSDSWDGRLYKVLQMSRPDGFTTPDGVTCTYTPNDCSVADVDGDGEYEIVVKWDPSNSQDNSNGGYTGNVYIDCYEFDGTQKWRIDLGRNIRAGAHYTQFLVYDFDHDGKAEMICKTASGSKDAMGDYVSSASTESAITSVNNNTDYSKEKGGYIINGPEFLTAFNGETGVALNTIWYNPNRAREVNTHRAASYISWESSREANDYPNRGERYLATVAYLDGPDACPSAVMCRGYYSFAYAWAVDFDGNSLTTKWLHASENTTKYSVYDSNFAPTEYTALPNTKGNSSKSNTLYANGNHNISVGDVDGDRKDEIIWGAGALDDDGKLMYATGYGHGDAIHLTDIDPDRPGLEVFDVHEESPYYGWDIHDAATGEIIACAEAGGDTGRGIAADIMPELGNGDLRGFEFWSSADYTVRNVNAPTNDLFTEAINNNETGERIIFTNFRTYWDGDLQDELLDGTGNITSYSGNNSTMRILTPYNDKFGKKPASCNSTKANPCLSADIFGDWREEMIYYNSADPSQLLIYSTAIPTPYLVTTPMQDHIYRMGIAWQNVAYNQPPHLGYYLPDVAAVKVTIGKNGYTTFCSTKNFTTKGIADVTAHTASLSEGSKTVVDLVSVVEVPAGEGVIIKGEANATYYLPVIYDANEVAGNILTGTTEATTIPANSVFVLNNVNGVEGFYNYGGTSMPANKAYISKSVLNDNGIKAFTVRWVDNETTAVHGVTGTAIGNGKNAIYNLQGIRVAKPGKGIYIVNGRKVVYN